MEEVKIIELTERDTVDSDHYVIVETDDGTRKAKAKYLRSLAAKSLYFDSVEDMKTSDNKLVEGDICTTLGYYEPGDGGGSVYRIEYNPGVVEDKRYVHYLSYSDTLRAVILLNDTVNVHQFGAYGDGSHDDSAAIQAAIDSGKRIQFNPDCNYVVRKALSVTEAGTTHIDGYGCTITPKYCEAFVIGKPGVANNYLKICNFVISAIGADPTAISIVNCNDVVLDRIKFNTIRTRAITVKCSRVVFTNLSMYGEKNITQYGIVLDSVSKDSDTPAGCEHNNDVSIRDITVVDVRYGIYGYKCHTSGKAHVCSIDKVRVERTASSANNYILAYILCNMELISIRDYTGVRTTDANKLYNALYIGAQTSQVRAFVENLFLFGKRTIDLASTTGVVTLSGTIRNLFGSSIASASLFGDLAGEVYSNVLWDENIAANLFTVAGDATGRLYDSNGPLMYTERTNSTSRINLTKDKKNQCLDTTINVTGIDGGIDGQIIAVRSSSNRSLINAQHNMELESATVTLSPHKYVLLQRRSGVWQQIS